ncbi:phage major tail tube protein, partial [Shigella sonnei]
GKPSRLTLNFRKNYAPGKELVEIDTINMIEKVNGVDRLEQHRRNIGL